jgi:CheY-like chemotaxis protein
VLVVDDDENVRAEICGVLREGGYTVTEAAGAFAAMRCVLADPLDVVVLDLVLPDGHGIEVARAFRAVSTTRDLCVVAMTAFPEAVEFGDPRTFGAACVLLKPIPAEQLLDAVDACFGDEGWTGEHELPETRLSS